MPHDIPQTHAAYYPYRESCAYRAFLETVNSASTACGPSYDYPEDLVQLKECTRDLERQLFFFFREKFDIQVLVSVCCNADPGTSIFFAKYLSITTIPTIKDIKFVYLRPW